MGPSQTACKMIYCNIWIYKTKNVVLGTSQQQHFKKNYNTVNLLYTEKHESVNSKYTSIRQFEAKRCEAQLMRVQSWKLEFVRRRPKVRMMFSKKKRKKITRW